MKGIIVVDIPETCLDCNFCEEFDEGTLAMCSLLLDENKLYGRVIDADYFQDKPDWCPIKTEQEVISVICDKLDYLSLEEIKQRNKCKIWFKNRSEWTLHNDLCLAYINAMKVVRNGIKSLLYGGDNT